jgi:hypothetical protein
VLDPTPQRAEWKNILKLENSPRSTLLATVRNPDVAGVHNEHDLNMLTRVAERIAAS